MKTHFQCSLEATNGHRRVYIAYLGQGDIGHNDGVHGAGGSAEGLVLVAVRVVLVLVDLAILRDVVPRHGAVANADVALGGHGGGLGAEVPTTLQSLRSVNCAIESLRIFSSRLQLLSAEKGMPKAWR